MELTTARPVYGDVSRVFFKSVKFAVAALCLYLPGVAAPAIYSANPWIRAHQDQLSIWQSLSRAELSRFRQHHQAVLVQAGRLESPHASQEFLNDAIKSAGLELSGNELKVALASAFRDDVDTLFNRITRNKVLCFAYTQVRHAKTCLALSQAHMRKLKRALEACGR